MREDVKEFLKRNEMIEDCRFHTKLTKKSCLEFQKSLAEKRLGDWIGTKREIVRSFIGANIYCLHCPHCVIKPQEPVKFHPSSLDGI